MKRRKPVLLVDAGQDSKKAVELFRSKGVEFLEYDIRKFEESCCGELPTTKAPSVFAPEGIFKGIEGVIEYLSVKREIQPLSESESAYW